MCALSVPCIHASIPPLKFDTFAAAAMSSVGECPSGLVTVISITSRCRRDVVSRARGLDSWKISSHYYFLTGQKFIYYWLAHNVKLSSYHCMRSRYQHWDTHSVPCPSHAPSVRSTMHHYGNAISEIRWTPELTT